ncbi:MAG: hypothetical protein EAZ54_05365 [Curvibacter sp.]|nr:MAG: hypothetical protein EAZ54_05365 [Curvibacter sp.]
MGKAPVASVGMASSLGQKSCLRQENHVALLARRLVGRLPGYPFSGLVAGGGFGFTSVVV